MAEVSAIASPAEQKAPSHDNGVPESPPPHKMTVKEYCLTRFSTLKPPMNHAPNPIRLVRQLSGKQWLFFMVAFLAWVSWSWRPFRPVSVPDICTGVYVPERDAGWCTAN